MGNPSESEPNISKCERGSGSPVVVLGCSRGGEEEEECGLGRKEAAAPSQRRPRASPSLAGLAAPRPSAAAAAAGELGFSSATF